MKPEEALTMEKLLNELQSVDTVKLVLTGCGESIYGSREVHEAIKHFVEKQVAKKPIEKHYEESGDPPYTKTICPNSCGVQVNKGEYAYSNNYCHKCGQKIDWSDAE